MTTKYCTDCKECKDLSEFYINSWGYAISRCKPCQRQFMARYTKETATSPEHETDLINYLTKNGVFAQHGKQTRYARVDVVAWGMIRIEVKLMKLDTTQGVDYYYAGNSPSQRKNGYKADIVCLVMRGEFYFFDVNHPAFYRDDKLKTKVLYTPSKQYGAKSGSTQFTRLDFQKARDSIEMIEELRQEWIESQLYDISANRHDIPIR